MTVPRSETFEELINSEAPLADERAAGNRRNGIRIEGLVDVLVVHANNHRNMSLAQ